MGDSLRATSVAGDGVIVVVGVEKETVLPPLTDGSVRVDMYELHLETLRTGSLRRDILDALLASRPSALPVKRSRRDVLDLAHEASGFTTTGDRYKNAGLEVPTSCTKLASLLSRRRKDALASAPRRLLEPPPRSGVKEAKSAFVGTPSKELRRRRNSFRFDLGFVPGCVELMYGLDVAPGRNKARGSIATLCSGGLVVGD